MRLLLTIFGFISLGLGILGMFLPILPTTPFLLLTAYCFLKSNKGLYDKLLAHKVLGPYITNFTKYKTISKRHKAYILSTLWLTIGLSIYLVSILWVRLLLLAIAIGVSIHILSFKNKV
jgi:uncharacterized membrane protein YbaN (DUF454 family)